MGAKKSNVWKKNCWVWKDIDKLSKAPIFQDEWGYIAEAKKGKIVRKIKNLYSLKLFLDKKLKKVQANSSVYFYDEDNNTSFSIETNYSNVKNPLIYNEMYSRIYNDASLTINGFLRNPFYKLKKELGNTFVYEGEQFILNKSFKLFEKEVGEIHYKILDEWESQIIIYLFKDYLIHSKTKEKIIPFDCNFIIIHLKN